MVEKIAFIGGGNIAKSVIASLLKSGFDARKIIVSSRGQENLTQLVQDFGVLQAKNNSDAVLFADVVVFAVKPYMMKSVCEEVAGVINTKKSLVISLATATRLEDIQLWLGNNNLAIVRTMTNTAAAVNMATTALYSAGALSSIQKNSVECIFKAMGSFFWVDQESDINSYSPLIGCGPAYLYLMIEALQLAAIKQGISPLVARKVALDVIRGAAELAKQTNIPVEELRQKVTTPKGVTETSLVPLLAGNYFNLYEIAFKKGIERCNELEQTLHQTARL